MILSPNSSIKTEDLTKYKPPYVHEILNKTVSPTSQYMEKVYL